MSNGEKQAAPVAVSLGELLMSKDRQMKWALRELLGALPERRDWLNPDAEKVLRDALAKPVAAALPAMTEDPMDIVRTLVCMADRIAELPEDKREFYPSPLADFSPLMQAARQACVERGYTEGGLAVEGAVYPAATPALPAEKVQGLTDAQIDTVIDAYPNDARWPGREVLRSFARTILAASGGVTAPALPVVPEGHKIAPLEPTEAMIHAAEDIPRPRMFGQVYRAMLSAAPELPEGNQQPQTDSGLAIRPSAEPARPHSFDDAAIERAALMHVAKDWHMISHLIPNYRCTEQFARLKAFAQELASGSAASGNTKPSCETCNDLGVIGGHVGQTAESFDYVTEDCPDCPSHAASTEPVSNFTATQAAQVTEQDAKYAERYKFLRDNGVPGDEGYADYPLLVYKGFGENSLLPDELDAAIDAAILANQTTKD